MMNLEKFKEELKQEMIADEFKTGETPIMDRLQIHLNNVEGEKYEMGHLLNPDCLNSDLWLSMLYQIAYPAKKVQKFTIELDGEMLEEGKNPKQTGMILLKALGVDVLKNHPKFGKYVFSSKEEFYKKFSNNVTLLEVNGYYLSVLHILYSNGSNTIDKISRFAQSINDYFQYQKIKIHDNSYYKL